jgi:glycosyltransferase involved in cell wall biosynthesis
MAGRSTTVLVEPDPGGHRFGLVADVTRVAQRSGDVVLLTSIGARQTEFFRTFLADMPIEVIERFDHIYPPTRQVAAAVAELCRQRDVATVAVMDADQTLKRWWYIAPWAYRGLPRRPRVVFMLTRYPTRVELFDARFWFLRVKALLVALAMMTRTLDRAGCFAGRDDLSSGWMVKRLRDPAVCIAHSRDRARLRAELGLRADRKIVGIVGLIDARKAVPLVLEATMRSAPDADLMIAGMFDPEVRRWVDALAPETRARLIERDKHLGNDELDQLVAACDVISVVQPYKGPSGLMGKALVAAVPVVTAGSKVRQREARVTGGGLAADMTVDSIAAALRRLYADGAATLRRRAVPPATAEEFAARLLDVREYQTS